MGLLINYKLQIMKVLHISTHNENCGIGRYQEMYLKSMKEHNTNVQNDFFPYSPNFIVKQKGPALEKILQEFDSTIKDYDLVHIQHEFSFFKSIHIKKIVDVIEKSGKKLISTVHSKPNLQPNLGFMYTPKGFARKVKTKVLNNIFLESILPLKRSDLVIVHNKFTKDELVKIGFDEKKIIIKPIPVPVTDIFLDQYRSEIDDINKKINRKNEDIIVATNGYVNIVKGTLHAVKAMMLLPDNYKLIIIGGVHPGAQNDAFLDKISDYIIENGLKGRVHITGFIEDDLLLNTYIANADIMIYPYLREYASSSAALNNAFAAAKPIVAFPAAAFKEINETSPYMRLCDSFSYYDLAREIGKLDKKAIKEWSVISDTYKSSNSYSKLASELLEIYSLQLTK